MGLETRLLPQEEWHKLAGTEAEALWPHLPESAKVIVVERDGEIVGCWTLMPVWHAEAVWIAPAHQVKAAVARRLWTTMRSLAASLGARSVFTSALDDRIRHLLEAHGAKQLPGSHYIIPVPPNGE